VKSQSATQDRHVTGTIVQSIDVKKTLFTFLFLSRFLMFFNVLILTEFYLIFFFTIFSYNKCRVIRVLLGLRSNIKSEITYHNCKTKLSTSSSTCLVFVFRHKARG